MDIKQTQKEKQMLLEAFKTASSFDGFPSGNNLIFLKKYLSETDFVEAIDYISNFCMDAFFSAISDDVKEKLYTLSKTGTSEEVSNAISTVVALNDKAFKAIDNGLRFGINVVAQAKNVNLNDQSI